MTITSIALAALLGLGAQGAADDKARTVTAPPTEAGGSAKAAPTRYCVVSNTTGTRMTRKTCMTRDQWLKRGFDPLAPAD